MVMKQLQVGFNRISMPSNRNVLALIALARMMVSTWGGGKAGRQAAHSEVDMIDIEQDVMIGGLFW